MIDDLTESHTYITRAELTIIIIISISLLIFLSNISLIIELKKNGQEKTVIKIDTKRNIII